MIRETHIVTLKADPKSFPPGTTSSESERQGAATGHGARGARTTYQHRRQDRT